MQKGDLLLQVNNLETHFKTDDGIVKAVNNVSFEIRRGETVGIVGESGSGKSVTSLSIMRLVPDPPGKIVGGEIIYHDKDEGPVDLVKIDEAKMRNYRGNEISMIFQEPMTSLNPVFTCGNQVMEAIFLHQDVTKQEAAQLTLELFEKVQLPDPPRMFKSYPHQLSGGQKQRVMIAMAMSCNPGILIADEPTTALDVTVQKTILDLMNDLKEKINSAVIFITHDLGVIAEIADRVIVMYKGNIVEQGTVLDIFENPQHPYTKGLLACRPPLGLRLSKLPVIADFMSEDENGEIQEKEHSIQEVIDSVIISEQETKDRMARLEGMEPMLKVRNLKTYFPSKRNIFGKPLDYVLSLIHI